MLVGMDWLETHKVKLDSYRKSFDSIDVEGNPKTIK